MPCPPASIYAAASGEGAHEAEVSFMRNIGFSESETGLMNELRHNRNGILYHDGRHDANYAKRSMAFLKRIYGRLEEKGGVKPQNR